MKRILHSSVVVAGFVALMASCTFSTLVVDKTVSNGTGSLRPKYDGAVVSKLEPGDAIVFYKGDMDTEFKKAAALPLDVTLARIVQVNMGKIADFSQIQLSKTVGADGYRGASHTIILNSPGEKVSKDLDYFIGFHNTGTVPVKQMVFVDYLPDEFTPQGVEALTPGSFMMMSLFAWTMVPLFTPDWMMQLMDDTWDPLKGDSVAYEFKAINGKRAVVIKVTNAIGLAPGRAWLVKIKGHFDYPALGK